MKEHELQQLKLERIDIQDFFRMVVGYYAFLEVTQPEFTDVRFRDFPDLPLIVSRLAIEDFGDLEVKKDPQEFLDNWISNFTEYLKRAK